MFTKIVLKGLKNTDNNIIPIPFSILQQGRIQDFCKGGRKVGWG